MPTFSKGDYSKQTDSQQPDDLKNLIKMYLLEDRINEVISLPKFVSDKKHAIRLLFLNLLNNPRYVILIISAFSAILASLWELAKKLISLYIVPFLQYSEETIRFIDSISPIIAFFIFIAVTIICTSIRYWSREKFIALKAPLDLLSDEQSPAAYFSICRHRIWVVFNALLIPAYFFLNHKLRYIGQSEAAQWPFFMLYAIGLALSLFHLWSLIKHESNNTKTHFGGYGGLMALIAIWIILTIIGLVFVLTNTQKDIVIQEHNILILFILWFLFIAYEGFWFAITGVSHFQIIMNAISGKQNETKTPDIKKELIRHTRKYWLIRELGYQSFIAVLLLVMIVLAFSAIIMVGLCFIPFSFSAE